MARLLELLGRWSGAAVGHLPELALTCLHRACGVSVKVRGVLHALHTEHEDVLSALAAAQNALRPTRTSNQKAEVWYKMCSQLKRLVKGTVSDLEHVDDFTFSQVEALPLPAHTVEPTQQARVIWLRGLQSRPELNGRSGVVRDQHAASGRIAVRVPSSTSAGYEDLLIKEASLEEPEEVPSEVRQALVLGRTRGHAATAAKLDTLLEMPPVAAGRRHVADDDVARLEPLARWLRDGGSPYALFPFVPEPGAALYRLPLLHYAAQHSDAQALKMLLSASADANYRTAEEGVPPLFAAAARAKPEIARALLDAHADIDACLPLRVDRKGGALSEACCLGNEAFALELIAHGANVALGHPVAEAAHTGLAACVSSLIANGADFNQNVCADYDGGQVVGGGSAPLHVAVESGHVLVTEALLQARAAPDARDHAEYTPLLAAVCHAPRSLLQLVEMLLNAGASVNACSDDGRTALWLAAKAQHEEAVGLLIARGAHINAVTDFGSTPLAAAVYSGQLFVVKALLAAGARTDVSSKTLAYLLKQSNRLVQAAVAEHDKANPPHLHRCGWCGTSAKCKQCGRCGNVTYCGSDCQRADWNGGHKKVCKGGGNRPSAADVEATLPAQARADLLRRHMAIDEEVAAVCLQGYEEEVSSLLSTDEMLRVLRTCRFDSPHVKRADAFFVCATLLGKAADRLKSDREVDLPTSATLPFLPELIGDLLGMCDSTLPMIALRAFATLAHTLASLKKFAASKDVGRDGGDVDACTVAWATLQACIAACADRGVVRQCVRYLARDKELCEEHGFTWEAATISERAQAAGCACVCLFHIIGHPDDQRAFSPRCAEAALRAGAGHQLTAAVARYRRHRAFAFASGPVQRLYETLLRCTPARRLLLEKLDIGIACECCLWAENPKLVQRHGRLHVVAIDRVLEIEIEGCAKCLRQGLESCSCEPQQRASSF
jgi:ankyrin repeat protein